MITGSVLHPSFIHGTCYLSGFYHKVLDIPPCKVRAEKTKQQQRSNDETVYAQNLMFVTIKVIIFCKSKLLTVFQQGFNSAANVIQLKNGLCLGGQQ